MLDEIDGGQPNVGKQRLLCRPVRGPTRLIALAVRRILYSKQCRRRRKSEHLRAVRHDEKLSTIGQTESSGEERSLKSWVEMLFRFVDEEYPTAAVHPPEKVKQRKGFLLAA